LSVLHALRVLRVLRLINKVQSMRKVVGGLLGSLPGLGSVFGLILIIFYVASVIATDLFSAQFPALFGDLSSTAYTLFQVMTLEGWSQDIARPVMEVFPYAWVFFILFILIATFIVFNLFIAVIVDSITADKEKDDLHDSQAMTIENEVKAVRAELAAPPTPRATTTLMGKVRPTDVDSMRGFAEPFEQVGFQLGKIQSCSLIWKLTNIDI